MFVFALICVIFFQNAYMATASDELRFRRGSHFMALGWMTSSKTLMEFNLLEALSEGQQNEWDTPFVRLFRGGNDDLACIFPEVSRTHHAHARGDTYYTTSDSLQRMRYDPMSLAARRRGEDGPLDLAYLERRAYDRALEQRLFAAKRVRTYIIGVDCGKFYFFKSRFKVVFCCFLVTYQWHILWFALVVLLFPSYPFYPIN